MWRKVLTLWLLVTVVEDDVGGMVNACGQILHGTFAKLVDSEDNVVDVSDSIYVVLKNIYAEWMEQVWEWGKRKKIS